MKNEKHIKLKLSLVKNDINLTIFYLIIIKDF